MNTEIKILDGLTPESIPFDELFSTNQPILLKGLVKDWPLVLKGKQEGQNSVMAELAAHDSQRPFLVYQGEPSINANFTYNDTCSGFNYSSHKSNLTKVLSHIRSQIDNQEHDYLYINSLRLEDGFPSLSENHVLNFNHPQFANNRPVAKIWLGTESIAAAHFDLPANIACCVFGKRRFTLFPPEQAENLYPGPLSPTPGGQVVTMADLNEPDFDKFPRLSAALDNALIVDMEPGDALYYPSMWWHQVQAFDRFNVMINFWWMTAPAFMGNPMDALMHGMLSIRDRPLHEKQAWKALYDYYVFGESNKVTSHLPTAALGPLGDIDDVAARRLRATLLNNLNR
ncbi:cupin-like domain-containing protein [Glaciecola sp. KUL10]|uniref:cupin-like domain-containing protein n=1 Tax=Glaciecola sp. (strain KUL10) TaxID=2161813 RepID=UPI000D787606|nr:cupin-like domain-containing protein [Glaciecola sp. KUL10]GBL04353.1 Pass1-related protein [Glaciecola sp. KUL10]